LSILLLLFGIIWSKKWRGHLPKGYTIKKKQPPADLAVVTKMQWLSEPHHRPKLPLHSEPYLVYVPKTSRVLSSVWLYDFAFLLLMVRGLMRLVGAILELILTSETDLFNVKG
jgi:hypothetical protein